MCVYEHLILLRRLNYKIYYLGMGTIAFAVQELILLAMGESSFLSARFLAIYGGLTLFPIILIHFCRRFQFMLNRIEPLISPSEAAGYQAWAINNVKQIFSLKTNSSRIAVIVFGAAAMGVALLYPPLTSFWSNVAVYVFIVPLCFVGGHGVYFAFAILHALFRLVKYDFSVPFYRTQNDVTQAIQNFYFETSLILLFCYIYCVSILLSLWRGNWSGSGATEVFFWLYALGFLAGLMFLLSFFQVHVLMISMKQNFIDQCSKQIQDTLSIMKNDLSSENVDRLLKLMEVQGKIEQLPEWPVNLNSSVTMLTTLGVPVASITLDLLHIK